VIPAGPRLISIAGLLSMAALAPAAGAGETQSATSSSEAFVPGAGGYVLNFKFQWTCDDDHSATTSSAGRIDILDPSGAAVGELTGTVSAGSPSVSATALGTLSALSCSVDSLGAGGSPADGTLSGTWRVTGLGAGTYSFRFWNTADWIIGLVGTTITTSASDAGAGGPISPPSVTLSAPQSATVFAPVAVGATASMGSNGNPLASVSVDLSMDDGASWSSVLANSQASSPSDAEGATTSFGQAGTATLRATATDTAGLRATSLQSVAVGKAGQAGVAITPAALSLTAGQSASFTASGGATGNYSWGGSAAGSGPVETAAFPSAGTYSVSVYDSGNGAYNPSAPATATVAVQAAFFVLSVAAGPGGSASGGGSYPPNSQATAVAAPNPGNAFAGWTGDATGASPTLTVLMSGNMSVTANFAALLPQTISFAAPGAVTLKSPPLTLSATASSGLPVQIALVSGPASLAGSVLTVAGTMGQVTLTATQPGNSQYLPAQPVTVSFPVGPAAAGVILSDDSPATKRTDRFTRNTSFRSGPAQAQ
jgi:uncharacterized repeat protein (TIGR02543 family)